MGCEERLKHDKISDVSRKVSYISSKIQTAAMQHFAIIYTNNDQFFLN